MDLRNFDPEVTGEPIPVNIDSESLGLPAPLLLDGDGGEVTVENGGDGNNAISGGGGNSKAEPSFHGFSFVGQLDT